MNGLPISIDWKGKTYNFILIIVDQLMKMVHYELVKVTINTPGLVKVIINVIIWHYSFLDSIVINCELVFTSKFWFILYYFFGINWRLSNAFYLQTDR